MKTATTTNPTTITPTTGTTIKQDAAEGKAIAKLIKARTAKGIKAFAADTAENGMDTRLGTLLLKLMTESSSKSGFATKVQLKTNNLDTIDRRDRSDAIWFATNRAEAIAFNTDNGGRFTTISTLQQAMVKATKEAAKEAAETDTDDSDQDGSETEADDSVIGGIDTDSSNFTFDENTMAAFIKEQCDQQGINIAKVLIKLDALRIADAATQAKKAA